MSNQKLLDVGLSPIRFKYHDNVCAALITSSDEFEAARGLEGAEYHVCSLRDGELVYQLSVGPSHGTWKSCAANLAQRIAIILGHAPNVRWFSARDVKNRGLLRGSAPPWVHYSGYWRVDEKQGSAELSAEDLKVGLTTFHWDEVTYNIAVVIPKEE